MSTDRQGSWHKSLPATSPRRRRVSFSMAGPWPSTEIKSLLPLAGVHATATSNRCLGFGGLPDGVGDGDGGEVDNV